MENCRNIRVFALLCSSLSCTVSVKGRSAMFPILEADLVTRSSDFVSLSVRYACGIGPKDYRVAHSP